METDSTITLRKRKHNFEHDCKCSIELKEVRSELSRMALLLEKYTDGNEKMLTTMQNNIIEVKAQMAEIKETSEKSTNLIQENITEIKDQIGGIQSSSLNIKVEQSKIKAQMAALETKILASDSRINTIETNIERCASAPSGRWEPRTHLDEKLIREVQERSERERNVIIAGLPEQTTASATERASKDEADVIQITRSIVHDVPPPVKVIRIGKYRDTKTRRVKVCYESKVTAKQLLRAKDKISEPIKIYSDQTPAQQKHFRNL
ncbi:jg17266, partial [Pararge aegeria aegeria]